MRRSKKVSALCIAALLGSASLATPVQAATAGSAGSTTSYQTIPGQGGTPMKALVITPNSPGPHPLLVMPASWSVPNLEYLLQAWKLAGQSDYEVVSYTSRGFWDSSGQIDVAGPDTVADVSRVIDWALANTPADANAIGVAGVSYGAGLGLLASAADPRIKAVAALSGWTDLLSSIYPGQTISVQALLALLLGADVTGRLGPDVAKLESEYLSGDIAQATKDAQALAPARSASTKIGAINANHPAILMANGWQDGIFPPEQFPAFFTQLTGPKRLMLAPGDHATPELPGLLGLPNDAWDTAQRWFDHYLRGVDNGVDRENPVQLEASNGGAWQGYPDWASAEHRATTSYLTGDGRLATQAGGSWSKTIGAGVPSTADSGILELTGFLQGYLKIPPTVFMPSVSGLVAGSWSGPNYATATQLSGSATLHTTIVPSSANTSLYGYLYDVGPLGVGSLVTQHPISVRDATPGKPLAVDLTFQPGVWNLAAGHHLAVVVDTVDLRFQGVSTLGSTVTFRSTAADPSWLRVPISG
jgi:predicted acyl esterase